MYKTQHELVAAATDHDVEVRIYASAVVWKMEREDAPA